MLDSKWSVALQTTGVGSTSVATPISNEPSTAASHECLRPLLPSPPWRPIKEQVKRGNERPVKIAIATREGPRESHHRSGSVGAPIVTQVERQYRFYIKGSTFAPWNNNQQQADLRYHDQMQKSEHDISIKNAIYKATNSSMNCDNIRQRDFTCNNVCWRLWFGR
jgi:hypothetical protein